MLFSVVVFAGVVVVKWLAAFPVALIAFGLLASPAPAAELRITFDELTRLVQGIANNTVVYLNNASGGLFSEQSYIAIGPSQKYPLPIPVKSFPLLGSTYGYYINDVRSTSVRITPVSGALRLTVLFEMDGPEAVPTCISGECNLADALPNIEWAAPAVHIDFIPRKFNGSISLRARNVVVGGVPRPVCKASADIITRTACTLGLPKANRMIAKLRTELPKTLLDQINQPSVQQQFADGLKKHLTIGQAGAVAINTISIEPQSMTVNFRFSTSGAPSN